VRVLGTLFFFLFQAFGSLVAGLDLGKMAWVEPHIFRFQVLAVAIGSAVYFHLWMKPGKRTMSVFLTLSTVLLFIGMWLGCSYERYYQTIEIMAHPFESMGF
jgi:hypothetical protein